MSVHEHKTTPRQQQFLSKVAERVVRIAQARDEFMAMGVFDRMRSMSIPQRAVQRAIYEAGVEGGVDLQTFRHYVYRGDSAGPYGPLVVRVAARGGEPVLPVLAENDLLPNHAGQAIDVYPPVD